MTLTVSGQNKLLARLVDLRTVRLAQRTEDNVRATAEKIRDYAKDICPVGTPESTGKRGYIGGSLQSSIRLQVRPRPTQHKISIGVSAGGYVTNPNTGRKVDYALWVEKGTRKMAAQPFMLPAMEKFKDELPKMFRGRPI